MKEPFLERFLQQRILEGIKLCSLRLVPWITGCPGLSCSQVHAAQWRLEMLALPCDQRGAMRTIQSLLFVGVRVRVRVWRPVLVCALCFVPSQLPLSLLKTAQGHPMVSGLAAAISG